MTIKVQRNKIINKVLDIIKQCFVYFYLKGERKQMDDKSLRNEIRNITAKSKYDSGWAELVEDIKMFMSIERRTWGNAVFVLIQDGLKIWKEKSKNEVTE